MIYIRPNQTFNHVITDLPAGLVDTITYELYDPINGSAAIAETTDGITEPRPGTYVFTGVAPDPAEEKLYIGRFDDKTTPDDSTYEEEVSVGAGQPVPTPPVGPSYATVTDLRNYSPLVANFTDDELAGIIRKAERNVDSKLTGTVEADTGRKVNLSEHTTVERVALRDATCEQALYRLHWGEEFFLMPNQPISGGNATTERRVPKFSPEAKQILDDHGFIRHTGRLR